METTNLLLENYIVCRLENENNTIFITNRSNFKKTNLCETYSNSGQKASCTNSFCYSLYNEDSSIHSDLLIEINNKFEIDLHNVISHNFSSINKLKEYCENIEITLNEDVIEFAENWIKENENHTTVKSWNYHDSHNWQSIYLENEDYSNCCTELEEEEQIKILEVYEEEIKGTWIEGATKEIETENYTFYLSRYATNPFLATLEIK